MRSFIILLIAGTVLSAVVPCSLSAQPNPFKVPKPAIKGASVAYALTGDMQGTAAVGFDGEHFVRSNKSTMKIMGKTSSVDDWSLVTSDSVWRADLIKKQGIVGPNILPFMAKAYDDLDGDAKKRFYQNIQDMAAIMGRAFGFANVNSGDVTGTKTYAGQECEERTFGAFSVCQMKKAPVVLHTSGGLVCMSFEETATAVKLETPAKSAFDPPPGITFVQDAHMRNADSVASGFVGYMASQALSDSLAKAKAELAQAQGAGADTTRKLTPEEQANMQAACEALKSIDTGAIMAAAADAWKHALADAAKNEAKHQAVKGIKGLLKKPKIP